MKKYLTIAVLTLTCLFSVICLFRVTQLKTEIKNLLGTVNNISSNLSMDISHIYSNINTKLEQQTNIIASSQHSYGDIDTENKSVILEYSVIPKEYNAEKTSVALVYNDNEYPLVLKGGAYTAEISIPLFEETQFSAIQLTQDRYIRTQKLNSYFMPRYDIIPFVYASLRGNWHGSVNRGDKKFIKKYDGSIMINIEKKSEISEPVSMTLLEVMDDKIIKKSDIPKNTKPIESSSQRIEDVNEVATPPVDYEGGGSCTYYFPFKQDVAIPFGSTYELYVDLVDIYGFHHVSLVDSEKISQNGSPVDTIVYGGTEAALYDSDGNLMFSSYSKYGSDFEIAQKISLASGGELFKFK